MAPQLAPLPVLFLRPPQLLHYRAAHFFADCHCRRVSFETLAVAAPLLVRQVLLVLPLLRPQAPCRVRHAFAVQWLKACRSILVAGGLLPALPSRGRATFACKARLRWTTLLRPWMLMRALPQTSRRCRLKRQPHELWHREISAAFALGVPLLRGWSLEWLFSWSARTPRLSMDLANLQNYGWHFEHF